MLGLSYVTVKRRRSFHLAFDRLDSQLTTNCSEDADRFTWPLTAWTANFNESLTASWPSLHLRGHRRPRRHRERHRETHRDGDGRNTPWDLRPIGGEVRFDLGEFPRRPERAHIEGQHSTAPEHHVNHELVLRAPAGESETMMVRRPAPMWNPGLRQDHDVGRRLAAGGHATRCSEREAPDVATLSGI